MLQIAFSKSEIRSVLQINTTRLHLVREKFVLPCGSIIQNLSQWQGNSPRGADQHHKIAFIEIGMHINTTNLHSVRAKFAPSRRSMLHNCFHWERNSLCHACQYYQNAYSGLEFRLVMQIDTTKLHSVSAESAPSCRSMPQNCIYWEWNSLCHADQYCEIAFRAIEIDRHVTAKSDEWPQRFPPKTTLTNFFYILV